MPQVTLRQIRHILHLEHEWPMIVVGAGDLGRAIAHYAGFVQHSFRVVGAFDSDPAKIGSVIGDLTITDACQIKDFIQQHTVKIALIAVPAQYAQQVCDDLVEAGVEAILNYAPTTLTTPSHVHVQHIDPVIDLQWMTYYLDARS